MQDPAAQLFTIDEVAYRLQLPTIAIEGFIERGELSVVQIDESTRMISECALLTFYNDHRIKIR